MMSEWLEAFIKRRLLMVRMVWFMLMASIFMYGFVLFAQNQNVNQAMGDPAALLADPQNALYAAVAICIFGFALAARGILRKFSQPPAVGTWNEATLRAKQTEDGKPVYTDAEIAQLLQLRDPEQQFVHFLPKYFVAKLIQFALCQAVSLVGFLLAMQKHAPLAYVPFVILSLIAFQLTRPGFADFTKFASVAVD